MRFAGIMENDFTDGVGVCVSFWTQGCPHHCKGCHNPKTWDYDGGVNLPENYVEKTIESLQKNGIKRNLSILGGEPLCKQNSKIVYDLVIGVKSVLPLTKIFIWTGYWFEDIINGSDEYAKEILSFSDLLIDGPFILKDRDTSLWLKGSKDQRVIDLKETFITGQVVIADNKF